MSMKFFKFYPESSTAIIRSVSEAEQIRNWVWRLIAEEGIPAKDKVVIINDIGVEIANDSRWALDFKAIWDTDDNEDWYLSVYEAKLVLDSPFHFLDIHIDLPADWFEYSPKQKSIEQIYGIL